MSEFRTGYVSAYDPERHMARVIFPDKGNLVSGWLPVSVRNSLRNHDEHHLDVNEHVACIFNANGHEEGMIISAIYDDKNRPPESDPDIRKEIFNDGTVIKYDRNAHAERHEYCDGTVIEYDAGTGSFTCTFAGGESINYNKGNHEVSINGGNGSMININDKRIHILDHWGSYILMQDGVIKIRAHELDFKEE